MPLCWIETSNSNTDDAPQLIYPGDALQCYQKLAEIIILQQG